jgi:Rrf2 family nitric oxide-sensitive transcriptional repressor
MTKINRKIEYALMALKLMNEKKPGELTSVKEVCEMTGAPFDATSKVLQTLSHHEVLKSEQGIRGGYQIIKDLKSVSFYELNEWILGEVAVAKCVKVESPCDLMSTCNIQSPILNLNNQLKAFYKSLSLSQVLSRAHRSQRQILNYQMN